jgi:putative peptide zinc metalloprotease protein
MSAETFPTLRRNLRFIQQIQAGKTQYVVKDPVAMKYFRFGPAETVVMRLLDGKRTLADVVETLEVEHGMKTSVPALDAFVRRLKEMGLIERTQAERSALLMDSLRRQRQMRLEGHGSTLLRMRFSLGDPDTLFTRAVPALRFFWTPGFVTMSLIAFLVYAVIVIGNWSAFTGGIARFYSPSQFTVGFLVVTYLTAVAIFIIHELGHGLTCKRLGGEVHEMGAMLLYFSPAFYCNVNDAWTFERRGDRLWVTFAGGWIQLVIAGVAAVLWMLLEPGTLPHQIAFIAMLVGGGIALLINFNPLIPLDGYYALMDWVEIPNLRARSFEYLGVQLRRKVLRLELPPPAVTPREGRIFLIYGGLAVVYIVAILSLIGFWFGGVLVGMLGGWGWAVVAFMVYKVARKLVAPIRSLAREWTDEHGSSRLKRSLLPAAAGLVVLVAASFLVPWTVRVPGSAVVEPTRLAWMRAAEDARVAAVPVAEGDLVEAGAEVALLVSTELELARARARAAVAALERDVAAALSAGHTRHAAVTGQQLERAQLMLAQIEERRGALTLRAPFRARVITPRLNEQVGARVPAGDSLLALAGTGGWRARVTLAQRHAGDIGPGSEIALRFPADPGTTWRMRVTSLAPAAREGQVVLLADLPAGAAEDRLLPGMTGRAKVSIERTNVAGATARRLRRLIRSDVLL